MKHIFSGKYKKNTLTAENYTNIWRKPFFFKAETNPQQAVHLTFISTQGLKVNAYSQQIQNSLILSDLFYGEK